MARATDPSPPRLATPRALARLAGRRLGEGWRAGPIHRLSLAGPRPRGLATRPKDLRPAGAAAGERLLRGRFRLRGQTLDVGPGGDPWDRPAPSRDFAVALHGFGWMGDLLATGEAGARAGLRLWLEWRRLFGGYNAFAWSGEVLERRVLHLAQAAPALLPLASDAEGAGLLADLARQARRLMAEPGDPSRALERAAAAALAGAALAGPAGERLLKRALPRLERAAPLAVLPDGVHATRSPGRGLALLFDLLALDDALSQRGAPSPVEVSRAIDRLTAAVRFFALADGRLAAFHGGEPGAPALVAAALALDAARSAPGKAAPYGGYQRLESRHIQLIADVAAPPAGVWSLAACAQPGAIEVVCGGRRLIRASGWSAGAPTGVADDLRGPTGGSCLALGEAWPGRLLRGLAADGFGPRLVGGPGEVTAERRESDDGIWLDIGHDGWRRGFGLDHVRRLFLDLAADELRGEDQLTPVSRRGDRRPVFYQVWFHLAPLVSAQVAVDGRSAVIRPAGAPAWRLRGDAAEMRLEPSLTFEDGEARQSQAIVLGGLIRPDDGVRVRWKLSRNEG